MNQKEIGLIKHIEFITNMAQESVNNTETQPSPNAKQDDVFSRRKYHDTS